MEEYKFEYEEFLKEQGLTEEDYSFNEWLRDLSEDIRCEHYLRGE